MWKSEAFRFVMLHIFTAIYFSNQHHKFSFHNKTLNSSPWIYCLPTIWVMQHHLGDTETWFHRKQTIFSVPLLWLMKLARGNFDVNLNYMGHAHAFELTLSLFTEKHKELLAGTEGVIRNTKFVERLFNLQNSEWLWI